MAEHHIPLVVSGRTPIEPSDAEARLAQRLLARELPSDAIRIACDAPDLAQRVAVARQEAEQRHLPATARLLLLAHENMIMAPGSVERLHAALDEGVVAAATFSPDCPPTGAAPDYHTLRGMERYAARISRLPEQPADSPTPPPLAILTTLAALQSDSWPSELVRIPGAWTHDFSVYRKGHREEILPLIPDDAQRVLDVGGGEGGFLASLKATRPDCETHLAEISRLACKSAEGRIDHVWQGDFLSLSFPCRYDCITFLDVLEHVAAPEIWLEKAHGLLSPGGTIVLSIPNVGHWSVIADLVEGRWDYAPAGIHCITHLRYFTRATLLRLLEDTGFVPTTIEPQIIAPPHWFALSSLQHPLTIDSASLSTYAFHVVASPTP